MRDMRPGLPLETLKGLEHKRLYHFQAHGVLWTVKREKDKYEWAALEPLPDGKGAYQTGSVYDFENFFVACGRYSPHDIPERWQLP